MATPRVAELATEMNQLIMLSGKLNIAVSRSHASEDVKRMNNLSIWMTLIFAFDGFVQQAYRQLGCSQQDFKIRKDAAQDELDVVLRLKILSEQKGLELQLPEESGDKVIKRHFLLRNKWAHNLGVVDKIDVELAKISSWEGPGKQAWPTEAGWSELRCAVENLTARVVNIEL